MREFCSMNDGYFEIYSDITELGNKYTHRGQNCIEVRPYSFCLQNPLAGLYTGVDRRMNYRFWAIEALSYIAGWGTRAPYIYGELMRMINPNYKKFSHEDGSLFGMVRYGDAFNEGLQNAYESLKAKPDSRQVYLSIWNRDTPHSYEDSPCMTGIQFFKDDAAGINCLSCLVNMRSNDLGWGVPYDVASMCAILINMADSLNMNIGHYYHQACSMHFYQANMPDVKHSSEEMYMNGKYAPFIPFTRILDTDMKDRRMIADIILSAYYQHLKASNPNSFEYKHYTGTTQDWVDEWVRMINWRWANEGASAIFAISSRR